MVTDPQTNKHSHKPTDRTDYNTLRRAASAQCNKQHACDAEHTNLIIVENGVETGAVSIEEVLVAEPVEVSVALSRVAEQRVRKPIERRHARLEPEPADVDDYAVGDV